MLTSCILGSFSVCILLRFHKKMILKNLSALENQINFRNLSNFNNVRTRMHFLLAAAETVFIINAGVLHTKHSG